MRRDAELKYLISVLLIISMGFFLLIEGFGERTTLMTRVESQTFAPFLITSFPNALIVAYLVAAFLFLHSYLRVRLPDADPLLLPAVALLSGIGMIMMSRLSPELALMKHDAFMSGATGKDNVMTLAQLGWKQCIFVVAGILTSIVAINLFSESFISWISSKKYIWVLLSIVLIITTMKFGVKINGKRLWLYGFQPIELVKLLMLLFMSGYIYENHKGFSAATRGRWTTWLRYGGPLTAMFIFTFSPIYKQGDLGPIILMFVVFILLFHYAGNPNLVTFGFIILAGGLGWALYYYGNPIIRERLDMLLDPFGKSENMARVLWSISSGGLFGNGIGYGQPFRIPEVQSDFNFAAICEEMGFIGGFSVVIAYAVIVHRGLKIAAATDNVYKKTLATGIAVLIGIQATIITSGNLCLIPITGVTMPLLSFGGSSMVITWFMIGILLRISESK